jgi:hypothetical protein
MYQFSSLLFILFLVSSCNINAQPRFDIPLNGTHHILPVAFAKSDTQQFVQLKDSFLIKNNRNEEVFVDFSFGGYIPQNKLEKLKVAPFDTNAIRYADRIKVMPNEMQWIRTGAYYKTRKERGVNLYINAFVVGSNMQVSNENGDIIRFEKLNEDGISRDVILVNEALVPTAFGTQFIHSDSAIGTWHYFDADTFPRIVQKAKRTRIYVQNREKLSGNCVISLKRNGRWKNVPFGFQTREITCYVDASTDSLKVESNGFIASLQINYTKCAENQGFSLYLIAPNQEYYIQNKVKIPFNFDSNLVMIRWNVDASSSTDGTISDSRMAAEKLQKEFPNLIIKPNPAFGSTHLIDFNKMSYREKRSIIDQLVKKPYISDLCGTFTDAMSGQAFYCDQRVQLQLEDGVDSNRVKALVTKYHFKLSRPGYYSKNRNLIYQRPVFDARMLRDLQQLGMEPEVISVIPNTYYNREFDIGITPPIVPIAKKEVHQKQ